jgi:hypothetical protein
MVGTGIVSTILHETITEPTTATNALSPADEWKGSLPPVSVTAVASAENTDATKEVPISQRTSALDKPHLDEHRCWQGVEMWGTKADIFLASEIG